MQMVHYCRSDGVRLTNILSPSGKTMESSSPGSPNSSFCSCTHMYTRAFRFLFIFGRACARARVCVGDCCGSVAMVMVELEAEAATVVEVGAVA